MFVGIEFPEDNKSGVALVHRKWLTPRKRQVWWPSYKQQDLFDKSLKKGESANDNWMDYKKALVKLKRSELNSDIQTDE
ncbi:hypothetical protein FQA39_LY01462 [Lamprigera yunnana]|nr:hypothetical protein FQA39_LY01462 [Lamprigera yunnana]